MDKYYYLIAQLPMLYFDREPFFSIEGFLKEAKRWMPRRDYRTLSRVNLFDVKAKNNSPGILRKIMKFEHQFRSELSQWRQTRGSETEIKPVSFPFSMIKEGNPLEVEKKMLQYRWAFIDELEKTHHFDLGFLILYYLKLQILQRIRSFNQEEGLKILRSVIDDRLEPDQDHVTDAGEDQMEDDNNHPDIKAEE